MCTHRRSCCDRELAIRAALNYYFFPERRAEAPRGRCSRLTFILLSRSPFDAKGRINTNAMNSRLPDKGTVIRSNRRWRESTSLNSNDYSPKSVTRIRATLSLSLSLCIRQTFIFFSASLYSPFNEYLQRLMIFN